MSSKTIAAFKSFRSANGATVFTAPHVDVTGRLTRPSRTAPTQPPGPLAGDLECKASELRRQARALDAQADDLEAAARSARRIERNG